MFLDKHHQHKDILLHHLISYHLKSRPTWEGFINNEILNDAKEYLCIDDVCVGTYK